MNNPKCKSRAARAKRSVSWSSRPNFKMQIVQAVSQHSEGSSVQSIKKYMQNTYQVNVHKSIRFIKKAIKAAVEDGTLERLSGRGATGSFKLRRVPEKSSTSGAAQKAFTLDAAADKPERSSAPVVALQVKSKLERVSKEAIKNPAADAESKKALQGATQGDLEHQIVEAVRYLSDGRGSSFKAIKKYLSDQMDIPLSSAVVVKALKAAVQKGVLVRTSRHGTRVFKLGSAQKLISPAVNRPEAGEDLRRRKTERVTAGATKPETRAPAVYSVIWCFALFLLFYFAIFIGELVIRIIQ